MEKRNGPSTEPCGTPKSHSESVERSPPAITYCFLPRRYVSIHPSASPETPNIVLNRSTKMSCSMVSNAADRSRPTSTAVFLEFTTLLRSSSILRRAVSVLCCFLYADCTGLKIPVEAMCGRRCARQRRSMIFEIVLRCDWTIVRGVTRVKTGLLQEGCDLR